MYRIAFVTDEKSRDIDADMPHLVEACELLGLCVFIRNWDDCTVVWPEFDIVVVRSTWDYVDRLSEFLDWTLRVSREVDMLNPAHVAPWALDKHYLQDLARYGVPIIPTAFVELCDAADSSVLRFLAENLHCREVVVKPVVGAYSRNVRRFSRHDMDAIIAHVNNLKELQGVSMLQPYLESVDQRGEADLVFIDGMLSHCIRKDALLDPTGVVHEPTMEFRKKVLACEDEIAVANSVMAAAMEHLHLNEPLLQGRVDLVRDNDNRPVLLELDIFEPSLNLNFDEQSSGRMARALLRRLSNR